RIPFDGRIGFPADESQSRRCVAGNERAQCVLSGNDRMDGVQHRPDSFSSSATLGGSFNVVDIETSQASSNRNHCLLLLSIAHRDIRGWGFPGFVSSAGTVVVISQAC